MKKNIFRENVAIGNGVPHVTRKWINVFTFLVKIVVKFVGINESVVENGCNVLRVMK